MREIKFRCWDKDFNEYSSYHLNRTTVNDIKECERFVFEQFTGLTDINGKEIYEGDILKDKSGSICFVVWDIITFAVESPGSQAIDVEPALFYTESEVIGNIYQDKHLTS